MFTCCCFLRTQEAIVRWIDAFQRNLVASGKQFQVDGDLYSDIVDTELILLSFYKTPV